MSVRVWLALLVLSAVTALNNVDRGLFALLLPELRKDIPLSDAMTGVLLGPAFMIAYTLASLPIAWLADRRNRRNIIALGLAFWSGVTALTGLATKPFQLLMLRGALGLGEASNIAPTMALAGDMVPARVRPFAFAVISVGTPAGMLLCFPLVGHISATLGWRAGFLLMGALGLLVSAIAFLAVREMRTRDVAAADGGMLQLIVEIRRALSHRPFRGLVMAGAFFSFMYAANAAWMPTFLVRAHGLTVEQVGATLGVYRGVPGILAALGGGTLGLLLARGDPRRITWVPGGLCLLIIPAELLLLFARTPSLWQTGVALESLLVTAATPCLFAIMVQLADPRARTQWSACYLLVFNLVGQSMGPWLVGAVSEAFSDRGALESLRMAMLLIPVSGAVGGLLMLRLSRWMRSPPLA